MRRCRSEVAPLGAALRAFEVRGRPSGLEVAPLGGGASFFILHSSLFTLHYSLYMSSRALPLVSLVNLATKKMLMAANAV